MIATNRLLLKLLLLSTISMWELLKNFSLRIGEAKASSWQKTAAMKRDKIFHKIPEEWVLPKEIVENAKDRRKLTGSFIEELLDSRTRDITNLDSVELVDAVSN